MTEEARRETLATVCPRCIAAPGHTCEPIDGDDFTSGAVPGWPTFHITRRFAAVRDRYARLAIPTQSGTIR